LDPKAPAVSPPHERTEPGQGIASHDQGREFNCLQYIDAPPFDLIGSGDDEVIEVPHPLSIIPHGKGNTEASEHVTGRYHISGACLKRKDLMDEFDEALSSDGALHIF
jgi:hypothetical protein